MILFTYNIYAQVNQTNDIYLQRKLFQQSALVAQREGNFTEAIINYRKVIETDKDTLLLASKIYKYISFIYQYRLNDTSAAQIADKMS
jgi:hypothetical protein